MCDITIHIYIYICDTIHSDVRQAPFIHMCDMTHPHIRRDLFVRETCRARICDMPPSCMWHDLSMYGVATVSRIDWIIGLFCRISSLLQGSFAKETYHFIDPTNWSHPICVAYVSSYDLFICVTWLIHAGDMIQSKAVSLIVTHYDSLWLIMTHLALFWDSMTHSDLLWRFKWFWTHYDSLWLSMTRYDLLLWLIMTYYDSCRLEFSIFWVFAGIDLGINSPALWPTELVLLRPG